LRAEGNGLGLGELGTGDTQVRRPQVPIRPRAKLHHLLCIIEGGGDRNKREIKIRFWVIDFEEQIK
jgi:hypothetical protein